jgi:hypothetical protein
LRIQICSNLDNDLLDMGFDRSARDPPTFQRRLHGRSIKRLFKQDFRSFDPRIPGLAHQAAHNAHFRFHPLAQISALGFGQGVDETANIESSGPSGSAQLQSGFTLGWRGRRDFTLQHKTDHRPVRQNGDKQGNDPGRA